MQTYIACPVCHKKFTIEPKQVGKKGRNVRCNECEHEWFVGLDEVKMVGKRKKKKIFSPLSPEFIKIYNKNDVVADQNPQTQYNKAANLTQKKWYHNEAIIAYQRWSWPVSLVCILVFSIVFLNLTSLSNVNIHNYPLLRSIYIKTGLASVYKEKFILADVYSKKQFIKGVPLLVIEGRIINNTYKPSYPPLLKITLKDKQHTQLYQWFLKIKPELINPQEDYIFTSRLKSPPVGLKHIEVKVEQDI